MNELDSPHSPPDLANWSDPKGQMPQLLGVVDKCHLCRFHLKLTPGHQHVFRTVLHRKTAGAGYERREIRPTWHMAVFAAILFDSSTTRTKYPRVALKKIETGNGEAALDIERWKVVYVRGVFVLMAL